METTQSQAAARVSIRFGMVGSNMAIGGGGRDSPLPQTVDEFRIVAGADQKGEEVVHEKLDTHQYIPRSMQTVILKCAEDFGHIKWGVSRPMHGMIMLVDISGFTTMTEYLCAKGPSGVETLMSVINGYFHTLISIVRSFDGEVLYFVGDALVVFMEEDVSA